jgi:hypothetical protein
MPGIFITKGMAVGVPNLTITMDEDGALKTDLTIHVRFDVGPTWLELARKHAVDAKARHAECIEAWSGTDEPAKAAALEREFEASMQAIMAAAIAFDALYDAVRKISAIPQTLVGQWKANKTARYKQIAETLKIAFGLNGKQLEALRGSLQQLYKLRDLAVHPSGELDAPILHPELHVGVEWRFAYFRSFNAQVLVTDAIQNFSDLVNVGKPKNAAVQGYADGLNARLEEAKLKVPPLSKKPAQ